MNISKLQDSISSQRNNLLSLNYDKLYGVFEVLKETDDGLEFRVLSNCLVCYKNQLDSLEGLANNNDISIIDLNLLSKGQIEVLSGPLFISGGEKIVMLSGGMIEFFESKNKKGEKHIHMLTSLRDAGATSINQRTTIAGRIIGEDILGDIEKESAEEAPFLGKIDGEYYLSIGNSRFEELKNALFLFLETKYKPNDLEKKRMFERSFTGVCYEDLGQILTDIITNERFVQFKSQRLDNVKGLEHLRKKVTVGHTQEVLYVLYNDNLNTYELKLFSKFLNFPDGFTLLGKKPCRLFTESENQYPRLNRIENADKINPSGAIKKFTQEIVKNVDSITSSITN